MIEAQWGAVHEHDALSKWDEPGLTPEQQLAKYGRDLLENARGGQWGLYRNTRLHMANIHHREGRLQQALLTYLEVCYLDLNGPCNIGHIVGDPELLSQFPAFSPADALLAPGVLEWVGQVQARLGLDSAGLESAFMATAGAVASTLGLPVPPDRAWREVGAALAERTT